MKALSLHRIAEAIKAPCALPDRPIENVCTDTRKLTPGCLFVALAGEQFDGHEFINRALEAGAACAVSMRGGTENARVLRVEDTRAALLAIANLYRRSLDVKVVGITGSVGKTTTKEMVACVLASAYPTLKTPANLNNEVGLSQTILMLEEHHRVAVLEMGTDAPGQIEPLARCAQPDVGIVTSIGVSHIERMGSREGIRDEKLRIRSGMADGAPLLLCGDNDLLREVRDERLDVVQYGIDNPMCAVRAETLHERDGGTAFDVVCESGRYAAFVPVLGRHNVVNALAAFAAGVRLGVDPEQAAGALSAYAPEGMRQKQVRHGELVVVEDCYNASPDSMRAALSTLGGMPCEGKRIAVLSDMLELGPIAEQAHREIGAWAAQCGVDALLCTGELAVEYQRGAAAAGIKMAMHFDNKELLFDALQGIIGPGDVLWFKASRGMRLEQVIERVYREIGTDGSGAAQ